MGTYKAPKYAKSKMTSVTKEIGETIEQKIHRIINNGEPITDGVQPIFTEKKDGVLPSMNVRTDRWEIATEAMDKLHRSNQAKREEKPTNTFEEKQDDKTPEGGIED